MDHHARAIPDGQITQTVYGYIRDHKWHDAVEVLQQQLQDTPESRAALSLLGHCYFHTGEFEAAAQMYEQLTRLFPDNDDYRLHHAHCLHKAGAYADASKAAARAAAAAAPQHARAAGTLQVAIAYEQGDVAACRRLLDQCAPDDPGAAPNAGCLLFKEGDYDGAARKFEDAAQALGRLPELLYGAAVCHFKRRQYGAALKLVAEIVERGVREHPELGVGSASAGARDVMSVGNSQALRDTCLVEALNLKAAVEVAVGNAAGAREALADMPPRSEEELDPVTLHNSALAGMEADPSSGFRKLNHLLSSGSFPPEAFPNLLLLYASPRHPFLDLAADVMADNPGYCATLLSKDLSEFLSALVARSSAPDEALARLDALAARHVAALRGLTKAIQDARLARDNAAIRDAIQRYDDALEAYVPVLMAMAGVYWERAAWGSVERVLRSSAEFCSEHAAWRLNLAHTYFMQERYADAAALYQPLVVAGADDLLALPAVVLANLCVCLIMTSQNEEAEELMRRVEAAEDADEGGGGGGGGCGHLHLAIINLVIGTLYCSKGNYEFGVSRVIKSLEPLPSKLSTDTWFYAKRCLLTAAEGLAKHTVAFKDASWAEVGAFLEAAEAAGRGVPAAFAGAGAAGGGGGEEGRSVAEEARMVRWLMARLGEQR
ncbi:MAG: flagellar associated protein [Monoraphidium minutum]|nr:MAG: flagellar associated protein [Monoraphidium minutum]